MKIVIMTFPFPFYLQDMLKDCFDFRAYLFKVYICLQLFQPEEK